MRSIGNSSETTAQSSNTNETSDLTFTNQADSPAFIGTPLASNSLLATDAQNKIISLTPSSTNLGANNSRFQSGYFNTLNSTTLNVNDLLEVTASKVDINSDLTVDNTLTAAAANVSGTLTANDIFVSTVFNVNDKLQVTANAVDVKHALTVGVGHTLTAPTANITTLTANTLNSTTLNVNDKLEVTANAVDVNTALTLSAGNTLRAPIANISILDSYSINAVTFKVANKLDIISNSVDVYTDLNVTTGNTLTSPIAVFGTLTTDSFTTNSFNTQMLTTTNLTANTTNITGYLSTPNVITTSLTATTLNSTLSPKLNTVVNLGLTTNRFANGYFTNVDSTSITAETLNSNLLPKLNTVIKLGNHTRRFDTGYFTTVISQDVLATTLNATDTLTVGNSCVASNWVQGGNYACFRHKDNTAPQNYAVLSDAAGNTFINAGSTLHLRVNNANDVTLTASGITTAKNLSCGAVSCGAVNCGAVSCGNVDCADISCENLTTPYHLASEIGTPIRTFASAYITIVYGAETSSQPNGELQLRNKNGGAGLIHIFNHAILSSYTIQASDRRIKNNIRAYEDGWGDFKKIQVRTYTRYNETKRRVGVVADEIRDNTVTLISNAYEETDTMEIGGKTYKNFGAVGYETLYRMNLRVTQQLQERVEALEARLAQIK